LTEERDPSGFKYRIPFDMQVELFRFAIDRLNSKITPALCKEDRALWKALNMEFSGCHCLLGADDPIVRERSREMKRALRPTTSIAGPNPFPVLA
jgi:hypothetical protein